MINLFRNVGAPCRVKKLAFALMTLPWYANNSFNKLPYLSCYRALTNSTLCFLHYLMYDYESDHEVGSKYQSHRNQEIIETAIFH